jgi:hypothetical protein
MPDPGRYEALAILDRLRAELLGIVDRLSPGQRTQRGLGGGDWSIVELLGHVESWEEHVLGAIDAWSKQQTAPIHEALNHAGIDAINAGEIARKARRSYEEQRDSIVATRLRLRVAFEAMSDGEWDSPPLPGLDRTAGVMLGSLLGSDDGPFTHDAAHMPDLRALLKS